MEGYSANTILVFVILFTTLDDRSGFIIFIFIMTIEQRKRELVDWIATIQHEDVIKRIENFRNNEEPEIPDTILELLKESSSAKPEDCIEHTNARELLGRQK